MYPHVTYSQLAPRLVSVANALAQVRLTTLVVALHRACSRFIGHNSVMFILGTLLPQWSRTDVIALAAAIATIAYFFATVLVLLTMRRANAIASAAAEANAADTQKALSETRTSNELTRRHIEAVEAALAETRHSNELTQRSVEIAQKTLEFSRSSFEATHQPSLHIVKIETTAGGSSQESTLVVRLTVRNTGTTDALGTAISGGFTTQPKNIDEPELYVLVPGEHLGAVGRDLPVTANIRQERTQELWNAFAHGSLYLVVSLRYRDDFGAQHVVGFLCLTSGTGEWRVLRESRKRQPALNTGGPTALTS